MVSAKLAVSLVLAPADLLRNELGGVDVAIASLMTKVQHLLWRRRYLGVEAVHVLDRRGHVRGQPLSCAALLPRPG